VEIDQVSDEVWPLVMIRLEMPGDRSYSMEMTKRTRMIEKGYICLIRQKDKGGRLTV
jgi:hypothetical protein